MSLGGLMMHIGLGRDQTCPIISASLVRGDPRNKHIFLFFIFILISFNVIVDPKDFPLLKSPIDMQR